MSRTTSGSLNPWPGAIHEPCMAWAICLPGLSMGIGVKYMGEPIASMKESMSGSVATFAVMNVPR
jgi:hypothetical protein